DLTEAEMAVINKVNPANPDTVSWALDLSGGIQRVALKHGCVPYGNGKARMNAFGLPDPIPVHREPIYTPRVDLVAKYPTRPDAESNSRAKMKALVTERVGKGVAWMPFHFGGWLAGKDLRGNYPKGSDPIVLGESANTITTYGYDPATGMQEPKVTLCQIAAA